MRDETSKWLEPLLDEAQRAEIDMGEVLWQASMPAAEAGSPVLDRLSRVAPSQGSRAVDWITVGNILRDRLGWDWYPDQP